MKNIRQKINQLRVAYFQPLPYIVTSDDRPILGIGIPDNPVCRETPQVDDGRYCRNARELVPFVTCARVGGRNSLIEDLKYICQVFGAHQGISKLSMCYGRFPYKRAGLVLQVSDAVPHGKFACNEARQHVQTWAYTNDFCKQFVHSLFI